MTDAEKVEEIIEVYEDVCNSWECGFMESVRDRLITDGRELTDDQRKTLDKIYEKVCNSSY